MTSNEVFSVGWNAECTIGNIDGEITGNPAEGFLGHTTITLPGSSIYRVSHNCQNLEVDETAKNNRI